MPETSVRIRSAETGQEVPAGDIGMIEVKGPNVFCGYWRMPEITEDGYFVAGDLGCVDEDGYIQIVGRGKDLIISGGFNVYPKEVETEIDLWTVSNKARSSEFLIRTLVRVPRPLRS